MGLPRRAQNRLLARCEAVELKSSELLQQRSNNRSQHVYFPTSGVFSLWTASCDVPDFEFAMVGNEGMLGAQIALGVSTATTFAHVQTGGAAWRMTAAQFNNELGRNTALRRSAYRYLHVTMLQAVTMARCSRFHTLNQRLTRWLLMLRDRMGSRSFTVTQESMAGALGVRRVGVTNAATELQRQGIIEYARGKVIILDGDALEANACSCYSQDLHSYAKFMA